MMPLDGKPVRRGMRRAMRGESRGRYPRPVRTTYGRHQRERDHRARWAAARAEEGS